MCIIVRVSNNPNGLLLQFENFGDIGLGGYAQYNGAIKDFLHFLHFCIDHKYLKMVD